MGFGDRKYATCWRSACLRRALAYMSGAKMALRDVTDRDGYTCVCGKPAKWFMVENPRD